MNCRTLVWSALFLSCCGCATVAPLPPQPRSAPFSISEYAPYDSAGTASIYGQAFAKTAGGEVKYAAGDEVMLDPVTTYSQEWWQESVVGGKTLGPGDQRVYHYQRVAVADGEGRFHFDALPAGDYFVICGMEWQWGRYPSERAQVRLGTRVHLSEGERRDVILPPVSSRNSTVDPWTATGQHP